MSSNNVSTVTLNAAVFEAYKQEQYVKQDGTRDMEKMRERIFETVSSEKVLGKRERETKATTRGQLLASVFPKLDDGSDEPDHEKAALTIAVWKAIDSEVWSETKPDSDARIQRMVGVNMGNGYVLCRTKVGKDRTDAAYITDVLECIRLDFTRPDNMALDRRISRSTRNREMLILRQPEHSGAYASEYDRTLKNALTEAHNRVQLTIDAVSSSSDYEDDDDEAES